MEVSEEDNFDFDIQNDAVYECEVRFVVKKSQTSDKNFHYFFVNDQQFNRIAIHKSGTSYFRCGFPFKVITTMPPSLWIFG